MSDQCYHAREKKYSYHNPYAGQYMDLYRDRTPQFIERFDVTNNKLNVIMIIILFITCYCCHKYSKTNR